MRTLRPTTDERSDRRILADNRRLVNECQGVDAGFGHRRLIEQRQRSREVEIRIGRNDTRNRKVFQRLGDKDCAGCRVLHLVRVFGIRQKRELAGTGLLHPGNSGNLEARIAMHFAAKCRRNLP